MARAEGFQVLSTNLAVEKQAEQAHVDKESIWHLLKFGSEFEVLEKLRANPELNKIRGSVGELPVHMAFIFDRPTLGRRIMSEFPELFTAIYDNSISPQHDLYHGENCLHIAIVKNDLTSFRFLAERCPDLFNQRATGSFFQHPNPCYFGEYALSFAVSCDRIEMVRHLVEKGADMLARDSLGNTALHMCVLHGRLDMFDSLMELWKHKCLKSRGADGKSLHALDELMQQTNTEGLTPFTLAAQLGRHELFLHVLNQRKQTQWEYGPIKCQLYSIRELDTADRGPSQKSALEHIVSEAHLDLLTLPILVELLKKKWVRVLRGKFLSRLATYIFFLAYVMGVTMFQPKRTDTSLTEEWVKLALELVIVAAVIYKLSVEGRQACSGGLRKYFGGSGAMFFENLVSLSFCFFVLVTVLLRALKMEAAYAAQAVATILLWLYSLFFALGFHITGPFVVMISKMIRGDIARFAAIIAIGIFSFAQALFILRTADGIWDYPEALKISFLSTLGQFDDAVGETLPGGRFSWLSLSLLVVYVVFSAVLMLNVLIGMMGDTYERVRSESVKQWHLEWARIMFELESEMGLSEDSSEWPITRKYWTEIAGGKYLQVEEVDHFYAFNNGQLSLRRTIRPKSGPFQQRTTRIVSKSLN